MHIKKYDKFYTRRQCLESLGKGVVSAGILMPVFDAWAKTGDIAAAYPDEALQIETYSKGAVKTGGQLDAGNVDSVKDLLDPGTYYQVKQQGRVIRIKPVTTDIKQLNPIPYLEATERNAGKAQFDAKGNVVVEGGKPWIGGHPFPKADTAQKIVAGHTMNWGRHDQSSEPTVFEVVDPDGNTQYLYHFLWVDCAAIGRTVMDPKPYLPGQENKLRFITSLTTFPADAAGLAALQIWWYDQTRFPQLFIYAPSLRRIRREPANQRFEAMVPGTSMTASDTWMMGDPYLTWGNFKIVGKMPFIAGPTGNWNASDPNWAAPRVGGKTGRKFYLTTMELIPEAIVVEMEPTTYANAPVSKRRVWYDARTLQPLALLDYDKAGQPWKAYGMTFDTYAKDGQMVSHVAPNPSNIPLYSWCIGHFYDLKTNAVALILQAKQIAGGYGVRVNDPNVYSQFCTPESLQHLGA